jgi:hypothetical protein
MSGENASLADDTRPVVHSEDSPHPAPSSAGINNSTLHSALRGICADIVELIYYLARQAGPRPFERVFETPGPGRPGAEVSLPRIMRLCEKVDDKVPLGPDDVTFLVSARASLAAAAYPVTPETIAVTGAYLANPRSGRGSVVGRISDESPLDRPTLYGRLITRRRARYQVGLIVLVLVTIWLTMQTFAIQKVLTARDEITRSWSQNTAAIAENLAREPAIVTALAAAARGGDSIGAGTTFLDYCDYGESAAGGRRESATDGSVTDHPRKYISFQQQRLCDERRELRAAALSIRDSLRAWATGATPLLALLDLPAALFRGISTSASDAAAALRQWLQPATKVVTPSLAPSVSALDAETTSPEAIIFPDSLRTEVFSAGVLEVLLPALWALIGALVAVFRNLELKCVQERIQVSDYPAMRTSLVLGVMVGAAIGMFADFLRGTNHGTAVLSTAALGLLAGYAADGFFRMIDQLVATVFTSGRVSDPG